jgi:phospholipid/cholesterol/gamma-HCH transport system permease protein
VIAFLESIGGFVLGVAKYFKGVLSLFLLTLYWIFWGPFRKKPVFFPQVFAQTVFGGVNSILIVCFINLSMGAVLAMQSAYQLQQLGATIYVAALVAVSVTREIGPVLTALVIAGRVGAAITAELSTMKVTEQIEALETLALNPVRYLVVPRFLALLIMLPCLVMLADLAGMFGGFLIGTTSLDLRAGLYIDTTLNFLVKKDIFTGLFKSVIFSMVITMISCYQGLATEGGAEGVGRSTTNSVVISFIFIIVADAILTALFYFTGS